MDERNHRHYLLEHSCLPNAASMCENMTWPAHTRYATWAYNEESHLFRLYIELDEALRATILARIPFEQVSCRSDMARDKRRELVTELQGATKGHHGSWEAGNPGRRARTAVPTATSTHTAANPLPTVAAADPAPSVQAQLDELRRLHEEQQLQNDLRNEEQQRRNAAPAFPSEDARHRGDDPGRALQPGPPGTRPGHTEPDRDHPENQSVKSRRRNIAAILNDGSGCTSPRRWWSTSSRSTRGADDAIVIDPNADITGPVPAGEL